ncbi:nuclear transport factor 2 family protein [Rhodococcus opacus]|nr:nuclear transport factor 2 family protein [Rhodococcus opacus]
MTESTQALVATAVRELIGAHTQAQDAGRADDIVELYTPDGVLEVPGFGEIAGHDALRKAFLGWAPTQPQRHLVANTLITSATEEQATATSDVAFFQRGESGWSVQVLGRYEDILRFHGGAWRFHKRTTTYQA